MSSVGRPAVYVAAPYADAAFVREAIHPALRARGLTCASLWAESARGPEDFAALTPVALADAARWNDRDVINADVLLVLARDGAGGEMFGEARYALALGIPVVWHGRRTLSAWRPGVHRVDEGADYSAAVELTDLVAHEVRSRVEAGNGWTIRRAAWELHSQLGWALEELARHPGHRGFEARSSSLRYALQHLGLLDDLTLGRAREHARARLAARGSAPASSRVLPADAAPAPAAVVDTHALPPPRVDRVELDADELRAHLRTALGVIRDFLRTSGRGASTLAEIEREVDL